MLARVAAMRCRSPSAKTALTREKCALSSVACCRHQHVVPSVFARAGAVLQPEFLTLEMCSLSSVACCRHQHDASSGLASAEAVPDTLITALQAEQTTRPGVQRSRLRVMLRWQGQPGELV